MKTRIISGLIMAPLFVLVYLGGYPLMAGCFIIGGIGIHELFSGFEAMKIRPARIIAYVALVALYLLNLIFPLRHDYITAWVVLSVMASSFYIFDIDKHKAEDALATIMGIVYVIYFSFHVVLVSETGEYSIMVWLIFLSAFGADIFAYFTGYFFGKRKLCPHLSPKKTIEGAIGGLAGALVLGLIFGLFFAKSLLLHCIIATFIAAVFSALGDLTASAYKRKMGIKDYGNLIPGHGGIMDRFDSVLFTAPVIYYYIKFVLMH